MTRQKVLGYLGFDKDYPWKEFANDRPIRMIIEDVFGRLTQANAPLKRHLTRFFFAHIAIRQAGSLITLLNRGIVTSTGRPTRNETSLLCLR
jgi:hypothetical protein